MRTDKVRLGWIVDGAESLSEVKARGHVREPPREDERAPQVQAFKIRLMSPLSVSVASSLPLLRATSHD